MILSIRKRAVYVGVMILLAYGVLVSTVTQSNVLVLVADVISGLSVIGIAVLLYPLFKVVNNTVSKVYLGLRSIEGILMVIGAIAFSVSFKARDIIYNDIHIYVFILGGFFFYYLLYMGKFVPRFISIWGLLGIVTLALSTGLKLFGQSFPVLDYFLALIITNEVFLAGWLIFKGFKFPLNF